MKALIIVDVQNDFCSGGLLEIRRADEIVPIINELIPKYEMVIATQDYHPRNHGCFASNYPNRTAGEFIDLGGINQILWPDHCIQGEKGSEFHPKINSAAFKKVIQKGTDPQVDSYSGFFDNAKKNSTGLNDFLKARGIDQLDICGLATDYCVKFTALDALELGFKTSVISDACRAVNLGPLNGERALKEVSEKGGKIILSSQVFLS